MGSGTKGVVRRGDARERATRVGRRQCSRCGQAAEHEGQDKAQGGGYQEGEANRGGKGATGGGSQLSSEKRWADTLKAEGDAVLAARRCEARFLLFSVRARERSRARMRRE